MLFSPEEEKVVSLEDLSGHTHLTRGRPCYLKAHAPQEAELIGSSSLVFVDRYSTYSRAVFGSNLEKAQFDLKRRCGSPKGKTKAHSGILWPCDVGDNRAR